MKFIDRLFTGTNLLIGFLVVVIIALVFFWFTPADINLKSDNHITEIYFADNISIAHQKLIDRFNIEYKNKIKVIPINLPFTKFSTNERKELLARTLRSNSSRIDVFSVDLIWVPRFARWGQPLDQYFSQQYREKIINYALESCYYENQLMAMPLYIDVGMMYYRKDIIRTLPDAAVIEQKIKNSITWEDFIHLGKRFSHARNPFYIYPADNFEGLICSFVEGIASQNQSIFDGDSLQLNSPAARKTLQLLVDLVQTYHLTPPIVTKYDEFQCYQYALKHDGLFLRGWPGFLRHYRTIMEDTSKFDLLEMAPLPHFEGGRPAFIFGGWNLMISKQSTNKEAAIEFIKFVLKSDSQKLMFRVAGFIPIIQEIYQDSLFLAEEPDLKFYRSLMDNGVHRPYLVDYTKISDILSYYVHLAIKNELSVNEALKQATRLINSKQVILK